MVVVLTYAPILRSHTLAVVSRDTFLISINTIAMEKTRLITSY